MEGLPSSLFFGTAPIEQHIQEGTSLSTRLMQLRYRLASPTLHDVNNTKQKRPLEAPAAKTTKKIKLEHHTLVSSLSAPVQEALGRFREISEVELDRLREEGYDTTSSITKLIDKIKTANSSNNKGENSKGSSNSNNYYSREDLELVMELSGFNEEGAMRALVLRDELAKLRVDGFTHPEAIDELSMRMKRLVGTKRRPSLPLKLSPTSARRLTKRLRKARSMGSCLGANALFTSPPLPQQFSFEELESNNSSVTTAPLTPPRKRAHEEGSGHEEYLIKRQKLLEALDYEASHQYDTEDRDVTVRAGFAAEECPSSDGEDEDEGDELNDFIISDPISFGDYHNDDTEGLFAENDPFSVVGGVDINSSGEEGDEDDFVTEGDAVESEGERTGGVSSTSTHTLEEEQIWQYNPLLQTKKHARNDSRNTRTLF